MDILYTDKDVVVAIKPRGVLSEDAPGGDTMPALLKPFVGDVLTVHRLDRAVGGVMVYARHKKAAAKLTAAMQQGMLQKEYTAIVAGAPDQPQGELRDLLFHDARQNKTFVVAGDRKGAKEAILRYRVAENATKDGVLYTKLQIKLLTGRSHQIRVQLASRQLPLVGDGKYGSRIKAPFLALAATKLSFPHPTTDKALTFHAPTPADFPWTVFVDSHYEIERKFLIAYPDLAILATTPGCRIKEIVQTYLTAPEGETRRVRLVREGESIRYIRTVKRRVNALRAVEEETDLTLADYQLALQQADLTRRPIAKTRYCIPCGAHMAEIDIYDFWQDRATLEVELTHEQETFALPEGIRVIREVTDDKRYKNVNLAKELPQD